MCNAERMCRITCIVSIQKHTLITHPFADVHGYTCGRTVVCGDGMSSG